MAGETYDAVVIGAGQGGVPWAVELARAGRRTAMVERAHVGGTCINEGCTPTKTLVASAGAAASARRAGVFGVRAGEVSVDPVAVRQRKRDVVSRFRAGVERRLAKAGVVLIDGEASFTGPRTLHIARRDGGGEVITGRELFINTGARPARPDLPGLAEVGALDSTSVMELDQVPEHLIILGGGHVALEFGQMFRRFGARVTLVERGARLLQREDPDVAQALAAILAEDGVELLFGYQVTAVRPTPAGGVQLELRAQDGATRLLGGSHLLLAMGRTPNTDALQPVVGGVQLDARGFVKVDEHLRTTAPGVFGMGDVSGAPAFTHVSYDDFRILRDNLLRGGQRSTRNRWVPYTLFTDPQLGRVGLTEAEARASFPEVRVATLAMTQVARAIESDQTRGFLKAVVDARSGQVLGFAALGMEGGELATVVQVAMMGQLPCSVLRDAVFPHPGLAESLNNLFALLDA
jgi:pyruvate/2-oxoglutarate dehydrogenase complex dihydrolipoamide dehydrogenase (E3) component